MINDEKPTLAIIGAGIAGLACAMALSDRFTVSIFEKSRGLSGRMSTRRAENFVFDHGASFFRCRSAEFATWLRPFWEAGHVQNWQTIDVQVDPTGRMMKMFDAADKLVFSPSMSSIGKAVLATRPQLKTNLGCEIKGVKGHARQWRLVSDDHEFGPFTYVVSAVPVLQALQLLPETVGFRSDLEAVQMIGCHTLMLGYADDEINLPDWDCVHFVDDILSFATVNSRKPQRTGGDTLVVQTNHRWSEINIEMDKEEVAARMKERFVELTKLSVKASGYDQLHRWRYASTSVPAQQSAYLNNELGLAAIGDWCSEQSIDNSIFGKIEDGFKSGHHLSQLLLSLKN